MAVQLTNLEARVGKAVTHFWMTRSRQATAQETRKRSDQGARGAVTGGAQMDGSVDLLATLVREAGVPDASVFQKRALELPGFFRPTKEWDILVVVEGTLLAAIEAKSQVGPSFGNNFNNRTEEALGSATDLWTAFREGAFGASPRPWLGYLFMLEDCEGSRKPVNVREPHFEVFPEFRGASYTRRYELLCRKLVRERHYEAAVLLTSTAKSGGRRRFQEPAEDLSFRRFASGLVGHAAGYAAARKES